MTAPMSNVLITGAGRGIGLEFARRFADAGAHVHATVRDLVKADGLRALGASATIHTCDVTSDAHVGGPGRPAGAIPPSMSWSTTPAFCGAAAKPSTRWMLPTWRKRCGSIQWRRCG